jgi:hypothetical protein
VVKVPLAAIAVLGASPAAAQFPDIDTLLDCQLHEVSDFSMPFSAWSERPGDAERFGWLLRGNRTTLMSEDDMPIETTGPYNVYPRGGAYIIDAAWPHKLNIGTATGGEPNTNRNFELQLIHADMDNGRARIVVTHALFRHGTHAAIVDGGYVGSCRIVQGEAAVREFEGMSE